MCGSAELISFSKLDFKMGNIYVGCFKEELVLDCHKVEKNIFMMSFELDYQTIMYILFLFKCYEPRKYYYRLST